MLLDHLLDDHLLRCLGGSNILEAGRQGGTRPPDGVGTARILGSRLAPGSTPRSARMTIFASRPFEPCTVMTRTSPTGREIAFIGSAAGDMLEKPASEGHSDAHDRARR